MRKRPEPGNIRRPFRSESDTTSPVTGSSGGGGVRAASLPGGALVKDTGDKRPVSAHSILNSVTRHSSLKTKVLQVINGQAVGEDEDIQQRLICTFRWRVHS